MDDKRERIVTAARQRFHYYGVKKTTMQEVAQDAGVAVGTLYLYFKDKKDLVAACTEAFVQRHRDQVAAALTSTDPADQKLRAYLVSRFREAEATRTGSRHAAEITQAVLRAKPDRLQEEGRMMWETILALLKAGVAQRVFRSDDPEGDATVFLYSIAYFFPNRLTEPPSPPTEEQMLLVVDWFLRIWRGGRG